MTDDRRQKILESGMDLFLHYGFRRTTMGDIAKAAGMSRPTLYALYPCKEAIFAGVVRSYMSELNGRLSECFEASDSLADKLHKALEIAVIEPFVMFSGSQFKRDLLSIEDESVKEQIEALTAGLEQVYASCFEGHPEALNRLQRTANQMGRMINSSCLGIKERARSLDELRMMLGTLVDLVAAAAAGRQG